MTISNYARTLRQEVLEHLYRSDVAQFPDPPDELWTKVKIEFYKDAPDAVFKALVE